MVRSWYLDSHGEDPQSEHVCEDIDTATLCARTGVEVWYFHPDQIQVAHKNLLLIKLKHDRGYMYEDEVKVEASMENYEEKLKICFSEHLHPNEEIRLILEGSGFFDVRDREDKWIRIHVFAGDLLIVPAGIYHRFIPDKQIYIRARRYFVGEPLCVPVEGSDADLHPTDQIYVEHLFRNGTVDTESKNADAIS